MRPVDKVFMNFIQGRPHMDMSIGIGWSVMQRPLAFGVFGLSLFFIETNAVPAFNPFGLSLRQASPHRKIGFR